MGGSIYIYLYENDRPDGRCLLLAQELQRVSRLSPTECVQMVERLFASRHKPEDPAVIEIREPALLDSLSRTCAEFGISVEVAPNLAQLPR
jgi:hypothetical protein